MKTESSTGIFELRHVIRPGESAEFAEYTKMVMRAELMHRVTEILSDGREYTVRVTSPAWEGDYLACYAVIVLANISDAQVGEYCSNLGVVTPVNRTSGWVMDIRQGDKIERRRYKMVSHMADREIEFWQRVE